MQFIIKEDLTPEKFHHPTQILKPSDLYTNLLIAAGYDEHFPPVADCLRQLYKLPEGEWVVVSPVFWEATHNDALVRLHGEELQLEAGVANFWFNSFKAFFAKEGLALYQVMPCMWLMEISNKPAIHAKPVCQIANQSLMPLLTELDEKMYWQRFLTECQMFCHSNAQNQPETVLPINGVWVWGQGELNPSTNLPIYHQTKPLQELAKLISLNTHPLKSFVDLPMESIILLEGIEKHQINSILKQYCRLPSSWRWNNITWHYQPKPWWKRLLNLRKTHADKKKKNRGLSN